MGNKSRGNWQVGVNICPCCHMVHQGDNKVCKDCGILISIGLKKTYPPEKSKRKSK